MARHTHGVDIYTEIAPASAATIIGAGVVAGTLGAAPAMGLSIALTGVALGIAVPLAKSIGERHSGAKRR
ncbi:MAG TPA: hypothetical protein VMV79_00615 [Alphaproteobacteria bacterium]|nr:hypothetical protein [Alphaproteobacteria bacterium]